LPQHCTAAAKPRGIAEILGGYFRVDNTYRIPGIAVIERQTVARYR
jgi:hypothetical protein